MQHWCWWFVWQNSKCVSKSFFSPRRRWHSIQFVALLILKRTSFITISINCSFYMRSFTALIQMWKDINALYAEGQMHWERDNRKIFEFSLKLRQNIKDKSFVRNLSNSLCCFVRCLTTTNKTNKTASRPRMPGLGSSFPLLKCTCSNTYFCALPPPLSPCAYFPNIQVISKNISWR